MVEKVLTNNETLEIVYNSDESFSDSSNDSVSSSDNEIEDSCSRLKIVAAVLELLEPLFGRGHTL